jgi:hypothetical protein
LYDIDKKKVLKVIRKIFFADRHASGKRSITYATMIASIENDAISHFNHTACLILVSLSIKFLHIYTSNEAQVKYIHVSMRKKKKRF